MSLKNAILRPIEVFDGESFTINMSVSGAVSSTVPFDGYWANSLSMGKEIGDGLSSLSTVSCYFNDEFKFTITDSSETISVSSSGLARDMGFSGNEASGTTIVADYRPKYSWIPTFYTKDTDRWIEDSSQLFYGTIGTDGRGSGIPMTSQPFRTLEWTNEKAPNVMKEGSNITYTNGGQTYYPEYDRCFLNVLNSSRGAYSTSSATAGIYSGGVYFIDLINQYLGSDNFSNIPDHDDWDNGDIYFDLTNTDHRSNFVYAFVKDAVSRPVASDSKTASFYECTATLVKQEGAPTWNYIR